MKESQWLVQKRFLPWKMTFSKQEKAWLSEKRPNTLRRDHGTVRNGLWQNKPTYFFLKSEMFFTQEKTIFSVRKSEFYRCMAKYISATIFIDHFLGFVYTHPMTALTTVEIVAAKFAFEKFAATHRVYICHYHCDSGCYVNKGFVDTTRMQDQRISFCVANAQHQNGKAERCIHLLSEHACISLLHAQHWWPTAIDPALWPMSLAHDMYNRNNIPWKDNYATHLDMFNPPPAHYASPCSVHLAALPLCWRRCSKHNKSNHASMIEHK